MEVVNNGSESIEETEPSKKKIKKETPAKRKAKNNKKDPKSSRHEVQFCGIDP